MRLSVALLCVVVTLAGACNRDPTLGTGMVGSDAGVDAAAVDDGCTQPCPPCAAGMTCIHYPEGPECTPTCMDSRDCPAGRGVCVGPRVGAGACVVTNITRWCDTSMCSPPWFSECDENTGIVTEIEAGAFCRQFTRQFCAKGCVDAPDMGPGERGAAHCLF